MIQKEVRKLGGGGASPIETFSAVKWSEGST